MTSKKYDRIDSKKEEARLHRLHAWCLYDICRVYACVVLYCPRRLGGESALLSFVRTFRMPLFFFISGFVSFKDAKLWNWSMFCTMELKKVRGMLLPTFVMLGLFMLYIDGNYIDALFAPSKMGYWFTIVSFEMFSLYALSRVFTKGTWENWKQIAMLLMPLAIVWVLSVTLIERESELGVMLEMANLRQYLLCFIAGLISKMYIEKLNEILDNKMVICALFLIAVPLPYLVPQVPWAFVKLSRVFVVYSLFYSYRDYFDRNNFVSRSLAFIGKHTLEIYFLHYFLFSQMHGVGVLLASLGGSWLYEVLVVFPISVFICYICVFVRYLIKPFTYISELCFGPQKQ